MRLSIDGLDMVALIDTGADYSVMSGSLATKLKNVATSWDCLHIRTAGGHLVTPSGTCTSRITINGTTYPAAFVILPNCSRDIILGMDVLTEYGAIIDLQAKSISFSADRAEMPKLSADHRTLLRIADDLVTLPPRASVMIAVYSQDGPSNAETIMESDQSLLLECGVSVARGIVRFKRGKSHFLITNFTEEYQRLNKDAFIAFLEEIQKESDMIAVADFQGETDEILKSADRFDVNSTLPHGKQEKLQALLHR